MAGWQRLGREGSLGWVWGVEWQLAETGEGEPWLPDTCVEGGSSRVWLTRAGLNFPYSPDTPLPGYSLILGFL